ncbi:hypothetical protein DL98DRAFT_586851 [Cadophora sp. DSE1049]|nr:hypothetical protein DL98DRAFT_586851 [Cadophora sp. DSE1049]
MAPTKRDQIEKWYHAGAIRFQSNPGKIHEAFFAFSESAGINLSIDRPGASLTGSGCTTASLCEGITWDEHLWVLWAQHVKKETGEWVRGLTIGAGNKHRRDALKGVYEDPNFVEPWSNGQGREGIMGSRFVAVAMDNGYPLHGNGFGNCPESWKHPESAQREVKEEGEAEVKEEIKEEKKIKVEEDLVPDLIPTKMGGGVADLSDNHIHRGRSR